MAELSDADKEFIKELREAKENKSLTRREALSVAGGVLGGGVLGAAGTVETVSADASTTDSDGNVGLPDDRVDVFAEGVDSVSVDVGRLGLTDPTLIYVYGETGGGDLLSTYDPANYADLFAALNQIMTDAADGDQVTIQLPFTGAAGVSVSTTFSVPTAQATPSIRGWGYNGTVIDYTATDGTPAIDHPDPANNEDYEWTHFALSGPGSGAGGGGNGIEIGAGSTTSTNHNHTIRQLQVNDFPGDGIQVWGLFTGSLSHCQTESNGGDGIFVQRLNGGTIDHCISQMNSGAQLHAEDCINGVIGPGNDFDSAGGGTTPAGSVGVRVSQVNKRGGPNIVDNYFEQNETHVSLENNGVPVRGVSIRGNRMQDGTTGVHVVNNVNRSYVIENWFQGVGSQDILLDGTGAVLGPNTHINSTAKVTDNTADANTPESISQTLGSYPW